MNRDVVKLLVAAFACGVMITPVLGEPVGDVFGVDLRTGRTMTYRKVPTEYNEAEGIVVSPDGRTIALKEARASDEAGVGHGLFLWKLE
jgi:hypothetical protein